MLSLNIPFLITLALQGAISTTVGPIVLHKETPKLAKPIRQEAYIQMRISAIGVNTRPIDIDGLEEVIQYIDPASDLNKYAQVGDIILSIAGMPIPKSQKTLANFGNENTIVLIKIRHVPSGRIATYQVKRKPLSAFSPAMRNGLELYLRP